MDARVARLSPGVTRLTDSDPAVGLAATELAGQVDHWGFVAHPDLPDRPGPAFLLVALRPAPTLQHYDPEAVDYWVTKDGRGERRTLTHDTPMPQSQDYSWGLIRLVDRLGVSNEYLTFGGHLDAALIGDVVVAAFASQAPLLRRGGHSQVWDAGADALGAFFARLMVAVDFQTRLRAGFRGSDATRPLYRVRARRRSTTPCSRTLGVVRRRSRPPRATRGATVCRPRPRPSGTPRAHSWTPRSSTDPVTDPEADGRLVRCRSGPASAIS